METKGEEDERLDNRLKTAIHLLFFEHPNLPNTFNFKGRSDWAPPIENKRQDNEELNEDGASDIDADD